ncbi:unnamed protein product [Urochloa humidicola]
MMSTPPRQGEEEHQQEPIPVHVIPSNQRNVVIIVQRNAAHVAEHGTPYGHEADDDALPSWGRTRLLCGARPGPHFNFPYNTPPDRDSSSATTIARVPSNLRDIAISPTPTVVAIGPYHRGSCQQLEAAKSAAVEEFCRVASRDAVLGKMFSLAGDIRRCYDDDWDGKPGKTVEDAALAEMMMSDGCFLLQFMVSMCPDNPDAPPVSDPLMSRPEVYGCLDAIARDIMLLENQIPWFVLEELMELRNPAAPSVPVDAFLDRVASVFDAGNERANNPPPGKTSPADGLPLVQAPLLGAQNVQDQLPPPPHLLGLFHRRQVGAERTKSHRVPSLSSLSSTAVELAEMGVKLVASETKKFGDMAMSKRRQPLGVFGELSLAPVILNELTAHWLLNLAAYEASLGITRADNFAVSSYLNVMALLMNRPEDVQELRAKGLVLSAFSNKGTLSFFKTLAPQLHVGHRYYQVFESLQEYRQERWIWIAVHKFLYKNLKTIITIISVTGVLVGLFNTILPIKQHQG